MARTVMLKQLEADVREWFPFLGGRALAVSEMDPFTDSNKPTLPLALIGSVRITGQQPQNSAKITLVEDFAITFVLESKRYIRQDKSESPFYALEFIAGEGDDRRLLTYEAILDELLVHMRRWRTPMGQSVSFRQMDIEADEFAVYLMFTFRADGLWCPDSEIEERCMAQQYGEIDPVPISIKSTLLLPREFECCPDEPEAECKSPCHLDNEED